MAHDTVAAAMIVLALFAFTSLTARANDAASTCPVTVPNHHSMGIVPEGPNWHASEGIGTALWPGGKVVFRPGGAGQALPDGSLQMKFLWAKPRGPMTIEGKRLDTQAPPMRASLDHSHDADNFQPSYLIFPSPGCWEVTARVGDSRLAFVMEVVKPERTGQP